MKIAGYLVTACVALFSLGSAASAQENLFAGKRINFIVGFAAGGGTDAAARLVARHLARHIPGNPAVVVQNLPGAGGLRAIQTLDVPEASDGTTIVSFNPSIVVESLLTPDSVKVNFSQTQWLGAVDKIVRVCYMWGATGVKTLEEARKRPQVIVGVAGTGVTGTEERILEKILGVKLKTIQGYAGAAETHIALERGELEGNCGTWAAVSKDWLRDNKVNVLVRFQKDVPPDVPLSIPYVGDLVTDSVKLQVIELLQAGSSLGRPFLLSKAVSADRVKVLRDAFDKTMADPEFLADAQKVLGNAPSPTQGTRLQEMVKALYASSPTVTAAAKEIAEN